MSPTTRQRTRKERAGKSMRRTGQPARKRAGSIVRGRTRSKTRSAKHSGTTQQAGGSSVKQKSHQPMSAAQAKRAVQHAPQAPLPKKAAPMLATLLNQPPEGDDWLYEIKWDGYRAVALMNKKEVQLLSRNNKSFHEKFYPVFEALQQWKINAVIDGEIVVINDKGIAHFGSLQNWRSEADGELIYYVFDLLWYNGHDCTGLLLVERRAMLQHLLPKSGIIRMSESFATSAAEFLEAASKMGMEGIIAKKSDSLYHPGDRSGEWLKIKISKRHEVVIGGYTQNEGSSKLFSSLLVGVYENNKLQYTGKIGTGFTQQLQKELIEKFKKIPVRKCPFVVEPDVNKPSRFRPNPPKAVAVWVKPQLVCEVSYTEITEDGVMRHPSFEGMRDDKKAKEVKRETASPVEAVEKAVEEQVHASRLLKPVTVRGRKTLLNPKDVTQVRIINGHELKFSNLNKIFWPKEKVTKRDMLNYYYQVAPFILPYLKDRPQSLNRYPNGIHGKSFYQKDITAVAPDWIKMAPYTTSEGEDKNFLVPEEEASLLYMANLGAIEMNPWNSTIHKPDHPTWCILDLDPDTGNTFEQVIRTAQVVKEVLDSIHVKGYPKTSGSTGLHVYIPLGAKYTYDECQLFGKWIATQVHHELPKFTSIERLTRNRKGKLYVDYLQNRPKATLAAPYSLRPKPGATVSMPLHWEEVKKGLSLKDFTIFNAMQRIKEEKDLFKPVLGKGINLMKILKNI